MSDENALTAVKNDIVAGADFAAKAKEFSTCPSGTPAAPTISLMASTFETLHSINHGLVGREKWWRPGQFWAVSNET